jgi:hypothetical protein
MLLAMKAPAPAEPVVRSAFTSESVKVSSWGKARGAPPPDHDPKVSRDPEGVGIHGRRCPGALPAAIACPAFGVKGH